MTDLPIANGGSDYMTDVASWLNVQNVLPSRSRARIRMRPYAVHGVPVTWGLRSLSTYCFRNISTRR